MTRTAALVTVTFLIIASSAVSGDWYLLDINSSIELEKANSTVDFARGRMGDAFIVELDDTGAGRLKSAGLTLRRAAENVDLERLYLLYPVTGGMQKGVLYPEPLAVSKETQLVDLTRSAADVARKGGYMAVPLDELETPLFYNPPVTAAPMEDYYPLDTLADYVSQDSLYSFDTRLEQFYTRYITSDSIHQARDWLVSKFLEFGYTDVSIDTFVAYDTDCHNVICFKPGSVEPDKIIVVGGHYDSYNTQTSPWIFAPGADDNGSGTSVVLELARVFRNVDTRKSILFAAFSAEEVGLVGSDYMAGYLYNDGADLECMLNFDMVAYNPDEVDNVSLFNTSSPVYSYVLRDAALRVSTLLPSLPGPSGASDHVSFSNYGYMVSYVQEGDFNFPGWHTDIDISSRLNFSYFEQVVRMTAAAVGHIDRAAGVTPIDEVLDFGDGQALRLVWNTCSDYTYKVLYGTVSGEYTDTVDVAPGECSYDLTGLTAGETYYFAVYGINTEGVGPLYMIESSGESFVEPRTPTGLALEPGYQKISLEWNSNNELDLDHYRILRKTEGSGWTVVADDVFDPAYDDLTALGHVEYDYMVLAVDQDMNISDSSLIVGGMAATFDYPLLFVDETASGGMTNPSEEDQAAFYDFVFGEVNYGTYEVGGGVSHLDRLTAGQYENMYWIDDDLSVHMFSGSMDTVGWFLDYETNFLLAGWQTLYYLAGGIAQGPGYFVYDNFRITQIEVNDNFEFVGATGLNGWPDLETRDAPFGGLLPNIAVMDIEAGAEVIYTYNASNGNPAFEGRPVGVIYDSGMGKRIALGFPIYHLTESSAAALMAKIADYFAIAPFILYGDINGDEGINLLDAVYLINYLYRGGPGPSSLNQADVDASCGVNLLDVTYLINYLYRNGPQPQPGCVE